MALPCASPLMLSPTNESSNPFFSLRGNDCSQALILDLGLDSPLGSKHRLTPQELSLSLFREDYFDEDYLPMDYSTKRQRVAPHPTRSSTSSLASSTSSATPSEADSDLLDRGVNEDNEPGLLHLDHLSACPFEASTLTGAMGLGFHLTHGAMSPTDLNHSRSSQTIKAGCGQDEEIAQIVPQPSSMASSHGGFALNVHLNSFNLSDFISDHEQEQQQQHLHLQSGIDVRGSELLTPERPFAHRDVSKLVVRSNSYSPASSMSPQTPGLEHDQFRPLPLVQNFQRPSVYSPGEQALETQSFFMGNNPTSHLLARPGLPMRSCSTPSETLSCNPAHITPSHQRQAQVSPNANAKDGGLSTADNFFFSPGESHGEVAQRLFDGNGGRREKMSFESPVSQDSSPSQSHYNLWSSVLLDEEQTGDAYDSVSSPSMHEDSRSIALSYSAPPTQISHQQSDQRFATDARAGVMRGGRSAALAASQQSSPYHSPASEHGRFAERQVSIGGQVISGIITKRSRGRRVPNNPDELNNLGKSGKVYTCKVPGCGKCFKRSEHLKRHIRSIHTDDKPFTCHCGKTFSRHDNLNQHARVHTLGEGESPDSVTASLSPATSPNSLPSAFANTHLDGKRDSRLRRAVNGDQEDGEEDEELASQSEGEVFAMESEETQSA